MNDEETWVKKQMIPVSSPDMNIISSMKNRELF